MKKVEEISIWLYERLIFFCFCLYALLSRFSSLCEIISELSPIVQCVPYLMYYAHANLFLFHLSSFFYWFDFSPFRHLEAAHK